MIASWEMMNEREGSWRDRMMRGGGRKGTNERLDESQLGSSQGFEDEECRRIGG